MPRIYTEVINFGLIIFHETIPADPNLTDHGLQLQLAFLTVHFMTKRLDRQIQLRNVKECVI